LYRKTSAWDGKRAIANRTSYLLNSIYSPADQRHSGSLPALTRLRKRRPNATARAGNDAYLALRRSLIQTVYLNSNHGWHLRVFLECSTAISLVSTSYRAADS